MLYVLVHSMCVCMCYYQQRDDIFSLLLRLRKQTDTHEHKHMAPHLKSRSRIIRAYQGDSVLCVCFCVCIRSDRAHRQTQGINELPVCVSVSVAATSHTIVVFSFLSSSSPPLSSFSSVTVFSVFFHSLTLFILTL